MPVEIGPDGAVRLVAGRRFAEGTESGLAVEGDDPRLAAGGIPHASTHVNGGADEITDALDVRAYPTPSGALSSRPAFGTVGQRYYATDTGQEFIDIGSAWIEVQPAAHASSHEDGGADEITSALDPRAYPITTGTLAARPSAASFGVGLYWTTDEHILYRSDGSLTWTKIAVADYADLTSSAHASGHNHSGADPLTNAVESWTAPTLLNSWVNYNALSDQIAGYKKDPFGWVQLRGIVKSGTVGAGTPIFTLPSGYRPPKTVRFAVASNDLFGYCAVDSSGNVLAVQGSNAYFDLSPVRFPIS